MLRIIDKETGLFIRDDFIFDETIEIGLEFEPAQGFYLPKWDGEKWVEGKTQAEIDALKNVTAEPTIEERTIALEQAMLDVILGGSI